MQAIARQAPQAPGTPWEVQERLFAEALEGYRKALEILAQEKGSPDDKCSLLHALGMAHLATAQVRRTPVVEPQGAVSMSEGLSWKAQCKPSTACSGVQWPVRVCDCSYSLELDYCSPACSFSMQSCQAAARGRPHLQEASQCLEEAARLQPLDMTARLALGEVLAAEAEQLGAWGAPAVNPGSPGDAMALATGAPFLGGTPLAGDTLHVSGVPPPGARGTPGVSRALGESAGRAVHQQGLVEERVRLLERSVGEGYEAALRIDSRSVEALLGAAESSLAAARLLSARQKCATVLSSTLSVPSTTQTSTAQATTIAGDEVAERRGQAIAHSVSMFHRGIREIRSGREEQALAACHQALLWGGQSMAYWTVLLYLHMHLHRTVAKYFIFSCLVCTVV